MSDLELKLIFLLGLYGIKDPDLVHRDLEDFKKTVLKLLEQRKRKKEEEQFQRIVIDIGKLQEQKRLLEVENLELHETKRILEGSSINPKIRSGSVQIFGSVLKDSERVLNKQSEHSHPSELKIPGLTFGQSIPSRDEASSPNIVLPSHTEINPSPSPDPLNLQETDSLPSLPADRTPSIQKSGNRQDSQLNPRLQSSGSGQRSSSAYFALPRESFMKTLTLHRTRLFDDEYPLSNIDNASFDEDFKLDSGHHASGASSLYFYGRVATDLKQVLRLLQESEQGPRQDIDSSFVQSLFAKVAQEIPHIVRRLLEKHVGDPDKVAELMPDIDREIVTRFRKVYESEQWIKTARQQIDEKVEEINQYEMILATREIQLSEREALVNELQLIYQPSTQISIERDKIELRQVISQLEVRLERETASRERAKLEIDYLRKMVQDLQLKSHPTSRFRHGLGEEMEGDNRGLGVFHKKRFTAAPEEKGFRQTSVSLEAIDRDSFLQKGSLSAQPQAIGGYLNKLKLLAQSEYQQAEGVREEEISKRNSEDMPHTDPADHLGDPKTSPEELRHPDQQQEVPPAQIGEKQESPDSSQSREAST